VRTSPTRLSACAPKGILPGLETAAASLVDTHLFAAHDDEMIEVKLETSSSGASLDLARKTSGWHLRAPADRDLGPEEVEAATALTGALARAVGGEPKKDAAPFEARGRVTLLRAESAGAAGTGASEVIEIGAPAANGDVLVRRAFDGAVLRVDAATARKLAPRATALRGRAVWDPPIEGKIAESVSTSCGDVAQAIAREGDTWAMTSPAPAPVDNTLRVNLIDAVTRLKADAWIADADDGTFGFDAQCAITLRVSMDGGSVEKKLLLGADAGAEGGRGLYARVAGDAAVFLAPKDLRDLARTWLLARPALHAEARGRSFVFRANGITRKISGDRDEVIDGAAADDAIADELAQVYVGSALRLGAARAEDGLTRPRLEVTLDGGGLPPVHVVFGAEVKRGDEPGFATRADGTDATFFTPALHVRPILDALSSRTK
jgi:hypothetical protein